MVTELPRVFRCDRGWSKASAPLLQSDSCGMPLPNIRCRHHGTANPLPEVNRYVVVFQDFLISSLSGHLYSQNRIRIARLLAEGRSQDFLKGGAQPSLARQTISPACQMYCARITGDLKCF